MGDEQRGRAPETFDDRPSASLPGAAAAAPGRRPVRRALLLTVSLAAVGIAWLVVPGPAPQRPRVPPATPTSRSGTTAADVFALPTRGSPGR